MTIDGPMLVGLAAVLTSVGVLVNTLMTALVAWRVASQSKQITSQGANIQKIETATNSMKDALVRATAEAAHRQGFDEARMAGELRAAELAATTVTPAQRPSSMPLPVADDRTAIASERVAEATERVAAATEKKEKPK